jgi:predicted  nucleic acid-binding Zn-ribbon protein
MINKIKDNLALIVTAITLMGSIGAGVQSLGAVLNTLTGIDDRMNIIESEFTQLKESTMVSNDIAVLYEKINDLEIAASNLGRANEQIAYLQSEINSIRQDVMDSGWDLDQKYIPEKWEWTDLNSKAIRLETQIQGLEQRMWELDTLDDRITWLENNR